MVVQSIEESALKAEKKYEKAQQKKRNCAAMHGYRVCTECRIYITCDLQSKKNQLKINLDELNQKSK